MPTGLRPLRRLTTLPRRCHCHVPWAAIAEAAAAVHRPASSLHGQPRTWNHRRKYSTSEDLRIRNAQDVLELDEISARVRKSAGFSSVNHPEPAEGALLRPDPRFSSLDLSYSSPTTTPTITKSHAGEKWESLVYDFELLRDVSTFDRLLSPLAGRLGSEYARDMGIWGAIFSYCHRRRGSEGALIVWRQIFRRKCLYQTDGDVAKTFWPPILAAALDDEAFLESIWVYAEWMWNRHSAEWPDFYRTIITFCLENEQLDRALRWHCRLTRNFDPGRRIFFEMLKTFISNPDRELQRTLRAIYTSSKHHQLYDSIVAFLWSQGNSVLARAWRHTLLLQNDAPTSPIVRPFLKFLLGYFEQVSLTKEEIVIAESPSQTLEQIGTETDLNNSTVFFTMDRFENESFGFRERKYNDKLGAKWFASTWVSLGTAMRFIAAIGVEEIGPLSLQSIALREQSAIGVTCRIKELEELQINIGRSSYALAIRYLAEANDFDTLQDLLQSDLHPEVFDDTGLLKKIMEASSTNGDLMSYRLILAVQVAVSAVTMAETSNTLLVTCLAQGRKQMTLFVMDEFKSRHIQVSPSTSNNISSLILREIPPRCLGVNTLSDVDFYQSLSRRIAALHLPVATEAWHRILLLLSRQGRIDDFEQLALDILHKHIAWRDSDRPALKVHISDVPTVSLEEAPYPYYLLPRDLPLAHQLHPVQLIFDSAFADKAVRNSFFWELVLRAGNRGPSPGSEMEPAAWGIGRGLRLLAILRDEGIRMDVSRIRRSAVISVTELFGPLAVVRKQHRLTRLSNQLTVGEVKQILDDAWGSELLPSTESLQALWSDLEEVAAKIQRRHRKLRWKLWRFRLELTQRLEDPGRGTALEDFRGGEALGWDSERESE